MISRYSRAGLALLGLALYGGPVLAGLAGHGWASVPVFAALFLLYVAATRRPDLSTGAGWATLATMATVQVALVALVYGLGIVTTRFTGLGLALPLWAPVLLTGLSAGFGAWAFRDAAEMDVMLDSVLRALEEIEHGRSSEPDPNPWPEPAPEVLAAVDRALADLRALDTAAAGLVDPIVARLEDAAGVAAFDPLYDMAGGEGVAQEPAVDLALLRFARRPGIARALIARGEAGLAPTLLLNAPDPGVRAEAIGLVGQLIRSDAPAGQLPDPAWLTELHASFPGEGFDRLAAQCAALPPAAGTR